MSLIRLLDVSGWFWALWRVNESMALPIGRAVSDVISDMRKVAARPGADHVVACCDSSPTFRHAIGEEWRDAGNPGYAGYKGNREKKDPAAVEALKRVIRELEADGLPIFKAPGFEADDIIATITEWSVANGHDVDIATEDKDLFALVREVPDGPRVTATLRNGTVINTAAVRAKFGVEPSSLSEYLAILKDASDHVPGVHGCGKAAAVMFLGNVEQPSAFTGGFRGVLALAKEESRLIASGESGEDFKPKLTASQREKVIAGEAAFEISLRMTTLRTDVPIDCASVLVPRARTSSAAPANHDAAQTEATSQGATMSIPDAEFSEPSNKTPATPHATEQTTVAAPASSANGLPQAVAEVAAKQAAEAAQTQVVQTSALAVMVPNTPFDRQLEPCNFAQASKLARAIATTRKLKDAFTEEDVLFQMAMGRSMDLSLYQSLCMLYIMDGKVQLAAQLVVARCRVHKDCEYFRKKLGDRTRAVWVSKRRSSPHEMSWEFTLDDAKVAQLGGYGKHGNSFDPKSNWSKYPQQMCSWRAALFLAREEFTEVTAGIYDPDEIREQLSAPSLEDQ